MLRNYHPALCTRIVSERSEKSKLVFYNNIVTSHTSVTATPITSDRMAERMLHTFRAMGSFTHSFFNSQNERI